MTKKCPLGAGGRCWRSRDEHRRLGYGDGEQKAEGHQAQPQEGKKQCFQGDSFKQYTVVPSHSACIPGQFQAPAAARFKSAALMLMLMLALVGWASALPQADMASVISTSIAAAIQNAGRFGTGKRRGDAARCGLKGKASAMPREYFASGSGLTSEGNVMRIAMSISRLKKPAGAGLDCVCAALEQRGELVQQLPDPLGRPRRWRGMWQAIVLGRGAYDAVVLGDGRVVGGAHIGSASAMRSTGASASRLHLHFMRQLWAKCSKRIPKSCRP